MRLFLYKVMGFLMVVLVVPLMVLLMPIDKKYQYAYVKSSCVSTSNYIYNRIHEDSAQIDVAFLGSSHTMCGINDSIVQGVLEEGGLHLRVSNLGFCRLGRDMDYVICKDLLQHKKPKVLVLEVRQDESETGHPDFGYVADIGDVFSAPLWVNRSFASAVSNAFTVRLNYDRDRLCGKGDDLRSADPDQSMAQKNIVADTTLLYAAAQNRWERYYRYKRASAVDDMMSRFPKKYVSKIAEMATANGVKVVMIYIPSFGYPYHKPKELAYYRQIADVMMMPDSFYDDTNNWMEDEHLNISAARVLSDSAGRYVGRFLR